MEYIKGAVAILSPLLFIGLMLLAAFWEKDEEDAQKKEKPREQGQQSRTPIPEVEKQADIPPGATGIEMTERGRYSPGKQQSVKTRRDEEWGRRKKRRR